MFCACMASEREEKAITKYCMSMLLWLMYVRRLYCFAAAGEFLLALPRHIKPLPLISL